MIKIETPQLPKASNILSNLIKNQIKNKEDPPQPQKEEEKNNNESPKKEEENKNEDSPKKTEDKRRKSGQYKSLKFFKNLMIAPKNESTLKEVYQSLETIKTFEMSFLKNPPKFSDDRLIIGIDNKEQKQPKKTKHVNYPLSAIGLLKCDYGNGLILYGTGTLVGLNMVLTCAHILYSPILKRRCNSAIFYLNLSEGKYLDESEVETFAIPDEYEIQSNELYDYALCVLKEDLAKKGGYLGICPFDDKEDKTGYIYGYCNVKSTRNPSSSFKTKMDEYEIMGVKSSLRYIEEEKNLIYVGNKTKEGQDGSPIFKVIDDVKKIEKEKNIGNENKKEDEIDKNVNMLKSNILGNFDVRRDIQKYDVKIFAIDCSMTTMVLQNVESVMLNNQENVNLNEMMYVRHHKALIIDENKIKQILRWMHFYENIMPRGRINQHIKTTKSIYNNLLSIFNLMSGGLFNFQTKENKILAINCCDIQGKDLFMLLNSQFDISQLTVLDLSNNSINYEGIRMLSYQEGLCFNLIELNLAENMLNYKAAKYLAETEFKSLDKLNLAQNNIGPLGMQILAEKGKFPNLRELNVSENNLFREGAKALSNGEVFKDIIGLYIEGNDINDYGLALLSTGNLNKITELYLAKNKIGDEGIAYISNFKYLEILDLQYNSVSNKGIRNLCGKNFKKIKRLNLDNNNIGVEGTYIITLQNGNSLRSLSLVRNDICTKGVELISILYMENVYDLNISDNFINDLGFYFLCKGKLKKLKRLDVSLNRISDKGLVYLTEANFTENLNYLNLAGNDITDDGVKYICFTKMPNLETLDLAVNYLKTKSGSHLSKSFFNILSNLSLERNKIKAHGLKNLVSAKFFPNIITLNLAYCKLGNEGCQILSETNVSKIEELNLKDNLINDDGVIFLCKGNFINLKDLNLEDNDIAKKGIDELIQSLLKQLTFLRLKGNLRIDNKDIIRIQNSCDSVFEKQHNFTFTNFSQISYGAIRYCIRHPEFMNRYKEEEE